MLVHVESTKRALRRRCLQGCALGAILWASAMPAAAQAPATDGSQSEPSAPDAQSPASPPADPQAVRDIVVTGSRIAREGFSAPTPTTVIGAAQIQAAAPATLSDYVNQLPALVGSTTPRVATTGASATVGANLYNLRALGANRTLVLLNGHRVAPSTLTGNIDVNLLPQAIVQRVDVVTGGASAAWGSDAVAGVVNYVLDTRFTGLMGNIQSGISDAGDARTFKAELSWGSSFADNRAHILLSGEYHDDGAADYVTSRGWFKSYKVVNNPAFAPGNGQPQRLLQSGVGLSVATAGGLITGPAALANTQFDVNGKPMPFNPGFTSGVLSFGGDGQDISQTIRLGAPVKAGTAFARASYDLPGNITAYGEFGYANVKSSIFSRAYERDGNITIRSDNAYLDPTIKARMAAAGISSFNLGKIFLDWGPLVGRNDREQYRYVGGLEGKFGKGWSWDAYFQHGKTDFTNGDYSVNPITANFNNAVDAVVNPATGAIVCRSTLTSPGNGCVPFNVFGTNKGTAAALGYIYGTSVQFITIKQDVASASLRGEPLSTWAGPVSVALGAEYRRESYGATTTALDPTNAFFVGNFRSSNGHYSVKEGFFETVVPLLDSIRFFKHVDFNGAVRYTDYSLSGSVVSWKLGLTWDVDDQLRFRGTRSKDIRAPNLAELFQAGNNLNQTISDPALGQSYSIQQFASGNTALKPEKADTTAVGLVYRPHWLPGFGASVDYFDIRINNAIYSNTAQAVINLCQGGDALQCSFITRNAANRISFVKLLPLNIGGEATRGLDIELNYRRGLGDIIRNWNGQLSLRAVGTYVPHRTVTVGGVTTDYAGTNANFDQNSQAVPSWRWLASASYDNGPFTGTLTGRFIGAGKLNNAWTAGVDIDRNHVPAIAYFDMSVAYKFPDVGRGAEIYAAVQNLFDKDPPVAPIYGATGFLGTGTNGYLYDLIGRQYRVGVRFRF